MAEHLRGDSNNSTVRLLDWYRTHVRPLLEECGDHERLQALDKDAARVERAVARLSEPLAICFLGESGVGKSTLINALVAAKDSVVPAGGVGPLTAIDMQVSYAEEPSFQAIYHSPRQLWRLVFALQQGRRGELTGSDIARAIEERPALADLEPIEDEEREDAALTASAHDRLEQYVGQAKLLVAGDQHASRELPYLLDSLRAAMGMTRLWTNASLPEDEGRLERLRQALQLAREGRVYGASANGDMPRLVRDLRQHAAGSLAPLIRELRVCWPSELLKSGLSLVDLPGLGVAADVFKEAAATWVRERANAIVLVVDRAGVKESSARLLRDSGFLNRLLFSNDDPSADPVVLLVAVVQIDNVALQHYDDDESVSAADYFAELRRKMIDVVKSQLDRQLRQAWSPTAAGPEGDAVPLGPGRQAVIERVLRDVQVHPVSALEYRKLCKGNASGAFLSTPDETGIPSLAEALAHVVKARHHDATVRLLEAQDVLWGRSVAAAKVIQAQWEGRASTREHVERLARELEAFLRPKRDQLSTRRGEFREFLKSGVPASIDALARRATDSAQEQFRGYLTRHLRDAHWRTLQAAVRKKGRHTGNVKDIDLPFELARRFEEPIAEDWSSVILKQIRARTRLYAGDCVRAVSEVVEWARAEEARVKPSLVEAIDADIRADIKKIDLIGKEVINGLRDQVRRSLASEVEQAIAKRCRTFVERGEDQGTGVKRRILDLFDVLAKEAAEAGIVPAVRVLRDSYRQVYDELKRELRTIDNPLDVASDRILESHRDHLERSDAQKRRQVLTAVSAVLQHSPRQSTPGVTVTA